MVSTGRAAVGAKPGRAKGNKQKAKYESRKKSMGNQAERKGKTRATKEAKEHLKSHCEAKQGRKGTEETEAE